MNIAYESSQRALGNRQLVFSTCYDHKYRGCKEDWETSRLHWERIFTNAYITMLCNPCDVDTMLSRL